jgi:hypothetical protein
MISRCALLCVSAAALLLPAHVWGQGAKSNDFERIVAPFLAKHCVHCHGAQKKKADLSLHVFKDEKSLLKDRKLWQNVARVVHEGEMPPPERNRPSVGESDSFLKAVRGIFEAADRAAGRDPGRVTMRRLNRAEYNNTIRDLCRVDFKPAEDFPSDDVGYGFDNIGDVLTLSPLLMERYLAAAEAIGQRAIIVGEAPKPSERPRIAIFLEPRMRPLDEKARYRPLVTAEDRLFASHTLTEGGDFKVRVSAYAQRVGAEPAQLAILVDDKVVKTFAVKDRDEKKTPTFEADVKLTAGPHRVAAQLVNPFSDAKAKDAEKRERTIFVRQIDLVGPIGLPPSHKLIMAHQPKLEPRAAAREILTRFATRAFRRPASKVEVDNLLELYDDAHKAGDKFEACIQLAIQGVLVSPKFLFRVELDHRPGDKAPHAVDDYQLASRLSYFLWSSMPDDELFALAAKKTLHQNLEAQVKRMLKDPRASALTENFGMQWLQLRMLKNFTPDPKLFPDFDDSLRSAMLKETELFLRAIIQEDRSILDLIDGNFTFVNDRLARHYGLKSPAPDSGFRRRRSADTEFVRVDLKGDERGGILTHASILAVTSNPTRTSPVKRGRWVLEQILGTPPPPPPPDVPELEESDKAQLTGSLRQRMEQHRSNPSCASCHARLDPIGFGFENYDAIGRYRTKDGTFAVDSSGTLPGGASFKGPGELKQILKSQKDLFSRCLTEKLLTYAIGRGLEYYDKAAVDRIVAALERNEYRFSTLALEIVKSDPFRLRRGKDANK